jgi:hypothetical protein
VTGTPRPIALVGSLVVVAAAACAPPASTSDLAQASETIVKQSRFILEQRELNTCNGETVQLAGEVHVVVTDKAGARSGHVNGHLAGTGSLGNEYLLNLNAKMSLQPGGQVVEMIGRELLISKAGAPNQLVTVAMTSDPFTMTVQPDCRG